MKKRILMCLLAVLLILSTFAGCGNSNNSYVNEPIDITGDLAYYSGFDTATLQELKGLQVEVTGEVSITGRTMFYLGDTKKDPVRFLCTFSQSSKELKEIEVNDTVTLHGTCTNVVDGHIYLKNCQISGSEPAANINQNISSDNTAETTGTAIPEDTTTATEAQSVSTKKPNAAQSDNQQKTTTAKEEMVWIPTNGGKKYHTHAGCSNMINPEEVTIPYAKELGFTPCKLCY